MSEGPDPQSEVAAAPRSGGNLYTFEYAQLRSRFIPGGRTEPVYQVTAQAIASGVYFFHNFRPNVYAKPAEVAAILNSLAGSLNTWSSVPGVEGMSAVQQIDDQEQFVNKFDVTVSSTSGDSSTVIRYPYPLQDAAHPGTLAFKEAVAQAQAGLDAVENA